MIQLVLDMMYLTGEAQLPIFAQIASIDAGLRLAFRHSPGVTSTLLIRPAMPGIVQGERLAMTGIYHIKTI
ncbi:MAG: hypothetical protein ACSLE1_19745, partial [Sphingobium sp.]